MALRLDWIGSRCRRRHISLLGTSGRDAKAQRGKPKRRFGLERAVSSTSPVRQVTSCARRRGRVGAVVRPPGCQRDSFWLPSCMCTSAAHASLLPAAERASRPTADMYTPPRRSGRFGVQMARAAKLDEFVRSPRNFRRASADVPTRHTQGLKSWLQSPQGSAQDASKWSLYFFVQLYGGVQ